MIRADHLPDEPPAPDLRIGYCTNVHAGAELDDVMDNLDTHAVAVRARLRADPDTVAWTEPMDVGLWLAVDAARRLRTEPGAAEAFGAFLAERQLRAFTFNGFPYGEFHRRTVKHAVYRPGWDDPRRLAFTRDLVEVMAGLHPAGTEAGISTVPIGWRAWIGDAAMHRAATNLRLTALHAAEVERRTGVCVHVDLEPEPGCVIDRPRDLVNFFERWLLPLAPASEEPVLRRHIRACHDTCHAAVMFDGQGASLDAYARAGIGVGKIQVSSALDVDFASMNAEGRGAALERLQSFAEPRYLHQVSVRARLDGPVVLHEDLPAVLAAVGDDVRALDGQRWRIHFHVPVHVDAIGPLGTTNGLIDSALDAATRHGIRDLEVETYAWPVLPEELQPAELADGIATELAWVLGRPGAGPRRGSAGRSAPDAASRERAEPAIVETMRPPADTSSIRSTPAPIDGAVDPAVHRHPEPGSS